MTQKRKKITMITGLVVGIVMLAGAAMANYNTSNGYDVGKIAAKGLLNNENYTASFDMKLSVDGNEVASQKVEELYDRNGDVKLNRHETGCTDFSGNDSDFSVYIQDKIRIMQSIDDGKLNTHVYKGDEYYYLHPVGMLDEFNGMTDDDKSTANKFIRFGELIADTLVGDLKNNIVYISGDDNSATYEINLDAVQIPEFANAGLSALFSSMRVNDRDDPLTALGEDPIVKSASLRFTIDNTGRLLDAVGAVTLSGRNGSGEIHTATLDLSLKVSDYGTTVPQRLDLSLIPDAQYANVTVDGEIHSYTE